MVRHRSPQRSRRRGDRVSTVQRPLEVTPSDEAPKWFAENYFFFFGVFAALTDALPVVLAGADAAFGVFVSLRGMDVLPTSLCLSQRLAGSVYMNGNPCAKSKRVETGWVLAAFISQYSSDRS